MLAEVARLTVVLHQFGLEIKKVDMTGCACHEELHDAFRLGRMMQFAAENAGQFTCAGLFIVEHGGERNAAEAASALPKEVASCREFRVHDSLFVILCLWIVVR